LNASDFVDLSEKVSQVVTIKYDACIVIGLPAIMADYQALGEAGIPVITYDSMVDGFDFSARVGSDNYVLGTQAAEEAIKYLESLDEINGEVICLNCPEGESLGDIGLPGIVVTPETVADFIAQQDKEYEALAPYKP